MAAINTVQGPEVRPASAPANSPAAGQAAPTSGVRKAAEPHHEPPPAPDPAEVRKDLDEALERLGDALSRVRPQPYSVSFHRDEGSGRTIIEIKNADGEVVKQYPPEKLLNLHRRTDDLVGMIVDEAT